MQGNSTIRASCRECGPDRDHEVVAERRWEGSEQRAEDYWSTWETTSTMLTCLGCGQCHLRTRLIGPDIEEPIVEVFPPPVYRKPPTWLRRLPDRDTVDLFQEVYGALHVRSMRIAAMGARALLDKLLVQEVGDVGSFEKKVRSLKDSGRISDQDAEVLEAALDLGSAAAHRGHKPSPTDLRYAIDTVEHLYHGTLLAADSDRVRDATPPRRGGNRKT